MIDDRTGTLKTFGFQHFPVFGRSQYWFNLSRFFEKDYFQIKIKREQRWFKFVQSASFQSKPEKITFQFMVAFVFLPSLPKMFFNTRPTENFCWFRLSECPKSCVSDSTFLSFVFSFLFFLSFFLSFFFLSHFSLPLKIAVKSCF